MSIAPLATTGTDRDADRLACAIQNRSGAQGFDTGARRVAREALQPLDHDIPPKQPETYEYQLAAARSAAARLGFAPECSNIDAREWAAEIIHTALQPDHANRHDARERRKRFVTVSDLAIARPNVAPLIAGGVLDRSALVALVGQPKTAKSYIAHSMSQSVQTGRAWLGHGSHQGQAFYLLNEVDRHFPTRDRVWRECNGLTDDTGLLVSKHPLALMDESETSRLINEDLGPGAAALVVVDTLARTIGLSGGEENSARDQGQLIANCDRIRSATGATVLVVHHLNKAGTGPRGSSALEAAVDSLLTVNAAGTLPNRSKCFRLASTLQRNSAGFDPIHLELRVIALDDGLSSCALYPAPPQTRETAPLTPSAEKMLETLRQRAGGLRWGEWLQTTGLPTSTFKDGFRQLEAQKLVDKAEGKWIAA